MKRIEVLFLFLFFENLEFQTDKRAVLKGVLKAYLAPPATQNRLVVIFDVFQEYILTFSQEIDVLAVKL